MVGAAGSALWRSWALAKTPEPRTSASAGATPAAQRRIAPTARSGPLDHVEVRQHVDVDVGLEDELALAVPFDPTDVRLGGRVADRPGHRNIADVRLHDLLRLGVRRHALLRVPRVAACLELTVERVVDPRLTLAGRLLAVEGVEVLVVRVGVVHEPADPDELEILLPEPLAEDARLENLEVSLHVHVLQQDRLNGLGEGLRAERLVTHRQRDLWPVLPALERRALELGHRELRVEPLDRLDPRGLQRAREARRDHGVGGDGEALRHLDDVRAVDRVGDRTAHLDVVERWLRDLREEVPGAGEGVAEDLLD